MTNIQDIIARSLTAADIDFIAGVLAEEDGEAITAVYDADEDIVDIEAGHGDGTFHDFGHVPTAEEIRGVLENLIEAEAEAEAA
ncbi:hypothetical protein BXY70_1347 [Roseovarius halotolerans]|uniref:Uncharacterized protein n=2 Tax=Roseovarius halotolerans TaxID=505353 RepID=A0A1X6Y5B0_9RHOB|nr:hypothetical protein [Roseovarius halotolerans]RKT35314.1 hypothetical protein BXY70_1347 [Roseovarius halotolerans]SLN11021.1 hypothetical protein ROH8110_00049 [Roseovarius halotolerans]